MNVNKIGLVLSVLLAASLCVAQSDKQNTKDDSKSKPDLSGTWILDPAKSNLGREISDYVLTIVHREPDITLMKKYQRGKRLIEERLVYRTDGKPETDPHVRPGDPSPVTRWQRSKLVRRVVSRPAGSLNFQTETEEEWILSQDKQTLTRTTTSWMGHALIFKARATFKRSP